MVGIDQYADTYSRKTAKSIKIKKKKIDLKNNFSLVFSKKPLGNVGRKLHVGRKFHSGSSTENLSKIGRAMAGREKKERHP